jgi:copper homeostasis protein
MGTPSLEIAVSTQASLLAALQGGASRVEVCSALSLGGLTPDQAWMEMACSAALPAVVLVRPRPGDFCYSPSEISLMSRSIRLARETGACAAACGALTPGGQVDREAWKRFRDAAEGMPLVFHRAWDELGAAEQRAALGWLSANGLLRILSAGGPGPACAEALQQLLSWCVGSVQVLAAGSIRPSTLPELLQVKGLEGFHSAATKPVPNSGQKLPGPYPAEPDADRDVVADMRGLLDAQSA